MKQTFQTYATSWCRNRWHAPLSRWSFVLYTSSDSRWCYSTPWVWTLSALASVFSVLVLNRLVFMCQWYTKTFLSHSISTTICTLLQSLLYELMADEDEELDFLLRQALDFKHSLDWIHSPFITLSHGSHEAMIHSHYLNLENFVHAYVELHNMKPRIHSTVQWSLRRLSEEYT